MQAISIDLVVDEVPLDGAERLAPADRIEVVGVKTCDYLVYPVAAALADKFCALLERHGDRPTSRVKDLVDIAVYATTCNIDGASLENRLGREIAVRKLGEVSSFALPDNWGAPQAQQFKKLARQTRLPASLQKMECAEKLACNLFDPVLAGKCVGARWSHVTARWEH